MSVQNIECQIASAQIGRYLNGDNLSPEALKALEGHVEECEQCQARLAERKAALQNMLNGKSSPTPAPTQAVVEVTERTPASAAIAETLKEMLATPAPNAPTAAAVAKPQGPSLTKPMIYSSALAVVLIAMSFASKSLNGMLATRGDQPLATQSETPPPSDTKPISTAAASAPQPNTSSDSATREPVRTSTTPVRASTPAAAAAATVAVKQATKTPAHPKPAPKKLAPLLPGAKSPAPEAKPEVGTALRIATDPLTPAPKRHRAAKHKARVAKRWAPKQIVKAKGHKVAKSHDVIHVYAPVTGGGN
ncbi:MAG: zf-HC2 domain-containing protein [Armatimonadetes bacterium]|nr:zf-HC2 domain-containing protein [Armatimonadota bacterium]